MGFLLILLLAVIVLLVIGAVVVGVVLKLLWWALIGLVIGALARLALPGRQPIGALATSASGIAGSLLGGIIAHAADLGGLLQFLIAIGVAAVIVAVVARGEQRAPRAGDGRVA
ncbi:MAG TPA: hypothetical protein VFT50_05440 [Baekduia sp.]|nr:hypothetical protein [Baekduia sp.]